MVQEYEEKNDFQIFMYKYIYKVVILDRVDVCLFVWMSDQNS